MERTNKTVVMLGLMIGTFLTAIEGTIVSTAMPKIVGDLQGIGIMNWVFSIFMLTSAVTVPLFGKLADLFGRKWVFTGGALLFIAGSVLCGLSWSMTALIVFRGIQGIGGGAVMTLSTTIIGDIYPVQTRAKMFGMIGMIWGIAGIFGPLVGGFFVDTLTWHWIFFINIPFAILAILLVAAGLKEESRRKKQKIDFAGAGTFIVGMVALLFSLQGTGENGSWLKPATLLLFAVSALFLGLFIWIEKRAGDPMIPSDLFRQPIVAITNVLALAASSILIGSDIYMPMWLQGLLGYSATASGFVLTPMSIFWMAGSFLCGRLLTSGGVRASGLAGTVLLLIGTFWMTWLAPDSSRLLLYLMTAILGLGFGIALTLTTICAQSAAGFQTRGAATASNQFFRSLGQTIGAAVFGTYFNAAASAEMARRTSEHGLSLQQLNSLVHPAGRVVQLSDERIGTLRRILFLSIHQIFVLLMILGALTVVLALLLPKQLQSEEKVMEKEA